MLVAVAATALVFLLVLASAAPAALAQSRRQTTDSDPLKQHYSAAAAFLSRGDEQNAASEYQAFLAGALHRAANADAQVGETARATELFTEALEFDNRDPALLDDFAALRFDHDQLPEAEVLLNSALAVNADDIRTHFLVGRVLFNEEKYIAAQPHLELAWTRGQAQSQAQYKDAWYLLAVTDLKLQRLAPAQDLFKKALLLLGDKASTHARLGRAYYTGDYPDEAVVEFKKAIALDPKGLGQHYFLGLAYLGHNPEAGYARAEPEFRAELLLAPSDFGSRYMLGYIALKQSRMPEAEREITSALSLKPDDPSALLLAAELFAATARDTQAEPLLRKAISGMGSSSPPKYDAIRAHYMLGRLLQRTGQQEEAAKELTLSEQLRKQLRDASGSTPKDKTAQGPQQNQSPEDLPRPITAAERAQAAAFLRQLSPPIALAFNNLGAIAANQHQCPACVTYFQLAGEWDPKQEGLDRNLGRAAFLCEQYEQAVPPLSRYLEQHADDVGVRSALGLSLFHLGQYEKVVEVLEPIQASIQSNPELAEVYATSVSKTEKK